MLLLLAATVVVLLLMRFVVVGGVFCVSLCVAVIVRCMCSWLFVAHLNSLLLCVVLAVVGAVLVDVCYSFPVGVLLLPLVVINVCVYLRCYFVCVCCGFICCVLLLIVARVRRCLCCGAVVALCCGCSCLLFAV